MNEINSTQDNAASRSSVEAEFQHLAEPYQHELLVHCYRILASMEDAEDALQETFLQVYRGLKSFEGRSTFSTWLFRLATNVCLMKIRHRDTEPAKLLPLEDYLPRHEAGEHPQILDWTGRPEEALLGKESREKMLEALEKLPADYRAVFILRDMEGFSNAQRPRRWRRALFPSKRLCPERAPRPPKAPAFLPQFHTADELSCLAPSRRIDAEHNI